MFYKERQDPMPNKDGDQLWRPEVVRTGKTVNVKELSKHISNATTLTQSDVAAVLYALPAAMNVHLNQGHTVRLDGLGTYTVYGRSKGNGVADKSKVRPSQFTSLMLKFRPEYSVSIGGNHTRALLDNVEFIHINRLTKGVSDTDPDENNGGGDGDDDEYIDPNA